MRVVSAGAVRVGSVVDPHDEARGRGPSDRSLSPPVVALGEGQGLADDAPDTAGGGDDLGRPVAVGDQPTQKGVADQRGAPLRAAAADTVNDRAAVTATTSTTGRPLIPGGFVEMDDLGGSTL